MFFSYRVLPNSVVVVYLQCGLMMNWRLIQDVPYLSSNSSWLHPGHIQVIYVSHLALPFIWSPFKGWWCFWLTLVAGEDCSCVLIKCDIEPTVQMFSLISLFIFVNFILFLVSHVRQHELVHRLRRIMLAFWPTFPYNHVNPSIRLRMLICFSPFVPDK